MVYDQFKEETYTRGLNVFTTITKADQDAAYLALRRGVMDYERRTATAARKPTSISRTTRKKPTRRSRPNWPSIPTATTSWPRWCCRPRRQKSPRNGVGRRDQDHRRRAWRSPELADRQGRAETRARRGAMIRVGRTAARLEITQMPEVASAFVAASTTDGAIKALVGGFDYNRNKFNHVTQAWRQPGRRSSPSSIRHRWKKACRRPPSSTMRRSASTPATPAARPGSRRTTTISTKARCRCGAA